MSNQTIIDHDKKTVTTVVNFDQAIEILTIMEFSQNCREALGDARELKTMEQEESNT